MGLQNGKVLRTVYWSNVAHQLVVSFESEIINNEF